jgi:hypothetical protein
MRRNASGRPRTRSDVLEGLEQVEWDHLEHAYGSSGDVPGLLRDLTSRRRRRRERALFELFGNIHHQGTVYSATAPAVPFLAELVRCDETDDRVRVELAWLLGAIAAGTSYLDVHGPMMEEAGERVDQTLLAEELRWVRAAREAVGVEVPGLVPLVGSGPSELSLSVAAVAALFPEHADTSVPLVRAAHEQERNETRRRLLALVLLLLGDRSRPLLDEVRGTPADDAEPDVVAGVVSALEDGRIPEQASILLEDLVGASFRGWDAS